MLGIYRDVSGRQHVEVPKLLLGDLYYIFGGVTPRKGSQPVGRCPSDSPCKLNWELTWKGKNKLWADPQAVPQERRWIRYTSEFLKRMAEKNAHLLDSPKIIVGRKINRNSEEPLVVRLDTVGFCPNNDTFCILPKGQAQKSNEGFESAELPESWRALSYEEQRLWLVGILSSELLNAISLVGRHAREITKNLFLQLPLPKHIDYRIIDLTRQIVSRDQNREPIPESDELRQVLNILVEESYGNPSRLSIQRTGISPAMEAWQSERKCKSLAVLGQVLNISSDSREVLLRLSGLLDDNEEEWLPLPQELPGWALDGTVFEAQLSEDIETFQELSQRPWALRKFRHTPYPYLNSDDLKTKLSKIVGLENR